jgi:hypothetical protein
MASERAQRRIDGGVVLALLAISGVLWRVRVLGPATLSLDPFGNADQFDYFYPLLRLTAARFAHWHLPLWNPQQLAGLPLLATPQAGAFYPPNFLHLLLPSERAMQVLAFAHLCLAGALLYALCRVLGARAEAAALGGTGYAWSSYVVGCHLWPPCLAALAFYPLPLLGIALIQRERTRLGATCLSCGVAALLLCGHFPLALYGLQASAAYAAWQIARPWPGADLRGRAARALLLGLAFAIGALIAAPQWLATLELVQLATRSPSGLTAQQLEPFGALPSSMFRLNFVPAVRGGGYAGVTTLLLLPLAFTTRRLRSEATFFVALALFFALVSLGSVTPLFALYSKLPGSNLFRGPARAMCMFTLGTTISAALATDTLLRLAREAKTGQRFVAAPLILASACTLWLIDLGLPTGLLPASALAMLVCACVPTRWQAPSFAAVSCVFLLDLAVIPATPDLQIWRPHALEPLEALTPLYAELAAQLGNARCIVRRNRSYALATAPRVAAMHGLHVFEDYEPLSLQRYADYATFLQHGQLYDPAEPVVMFAGALDGRAPIMHRRLLAAAGVRAIVRVRGTRPPKLEIDWLPDALPRAYIAHDLRAATSPTATLRALARGELGREAVALEELPNWQQPREAAAVGSEGVRIVNDEPERVVLDVSLQQPGALVLLDADYPGWCALVDGRPARIYNANYLFRALILQPGRHRVTFAYAPRRVYVGLALGACGLFGLLGQARGFWLRRRDRGEPAK